MKPAFQRDILIAYWLLFDEFEIGNDDPPKPASTEQQPPSQNTTTAPPSPPKC